jgi:hypothetical protein
MSAKIFPIGLRVASRGKILTHSFDSPQGIVHKYFLNRIMGCGSWESINYMLFRDLVEMFTRKSSIGLWVVGKY